MNNGGISLAARILMSIIFIFAGYGKIMNPAGTEGYMASVGLPLVGVLLILTIITELGGGLLLLVGFQTRIAAVSLAGFSVLAALIFHTNFADQTQMIMFMKNLAMAGGLLMIANAGPGTLSIDAKLATSKQEPATKTA